MRRRAVGPTADPDVKEHNQTRCVDTAGRQRESADGAPRPVLRLFFTVSYFPWHYQLAPAFISPLFFFFFSHYLDMIDNYWSQNKDTFQKIPVFVLETVFLQELCSCSAWKRWWDEMRWLTGKRCHGAWEVFMLTRIDAKMGVLMIHQDISVLSIMSQHLAVKEIKYKWARFLRLWHLLWSSSDALLFLPHVKVVDFSDAPSRDENSGTAWGRQNRKCDHVSTSHDRTASAANGKGPTGRHSHPSRSECMPRSTSSQRRKRRPRGRGDKDLPPAARRNWPWYNTGRTLSPLCSQSVITEHEEHSSLL